MLSLVARWKIKDSLWGKRGLVYFKTKNPVSMDAVQSLNSFNAKIKRIRGSGNSLEVLKVLQDVKSAGLIPNMFIFTNALTALAQDAKTKEMLFVYDEMTRNNLSADRMVFHTLMSGFAKSGELDKVEEYFQKLKQNTSPNTVTYNVLMNAYRTGKSEKLLQIYEEAMSQNLVDSVSFGVIVHYYADLDDWEKVKQWIDKMHSYLGTVDRGTWNNLLTLSLHDKPHRFHQVIQMMQDRNIEFDLLTYNHMMSFAVHKEGAKRSETTKKIRILFDEMLSKNMKPDVVSFATTVNHCTRSGDVESGFYFWNECYTRNVNMHVSCSVRLFNLYKARNLQPPTILSEYLYLSNSKRAIKKYERIQEIKNEKNRYTV